MHTALIKFDDEAGELKTSSVGNDGDDSGDNTCDVLWCDDKAWGSVTSSLSTTNSFCGSSRGEQV